MAKRSTKRNTQSALAGLAALGAYVVGKNMYRRPGEELAPVEDFSKYVSRNDPAAYEGSGLTTAGAAAPATVGAAPAAITAAQSQAAERTGGDISEGERVAQLMAEQANLRGYDEMYANRAGPVRSVVRPAAAGPARISNQSTGGQQTDLRGYDDMYANRFNRQIGMGEPGYTKEDMDAFRKRVLDQGQMATISNYKTRAGTRAGGPPVFTSGQRRDIAPTREEAIAQIPTGGIKPPEGGRQINSNETMRNLANIVAGLGPTPVGVFASTNHAGIAAALSNAQRNAAAARNVPSAQNAAAARRAQLAEEARRGQTPTNFTSPTSRNANKRTKKIDEDNTGVEFKRGGKTKKMASGGMTSASKRGDGIASKGKTKCKMY